MASAKQKTREARQDHPEWVDIALERLTASGFRTGGARTAVVRLLGAEGGCLGAEDVANKLRAGGDTVGTASVYRALGLLVDLGLLHKVALADSPARFELVLPDGEHHHHLVCDRCGRTVAFADERLEQAVESISERAPFQVEAHDVTLHGTCPACLAKA